MNYYRCYSWKRSFNIRKSLANSLNLKVLKVDTRKLNFPLTHKCTKTPFSVCTSVLVSVSCVRPARTSTLHTTTYPHHHPLWLMVGGGGL